MTTVNEWIRGKKTYAIGALSVLIGISRYLEGNENYGLAFLVFGAGLVTMRSALNNL